MIMSREFSEDLYWRIVYLHTDGFSTLDISNLLYISKSVINKIKKRYNCWMCVKNPLKVFLIVENYLVGKI